MEGIPGAARRHLGHEPLAAVMESAWLSTLKAPASRGSAGELAARPAAGSFSNCSGRREMHEPVQTLTRFEQLMDDAYEPVDPDTALSPFPL